MTRIKVLMVIYYFNNLYNEEEITRKRIERVEMMKDSKNERMKENERKRERFLSCSGCFLHGV